MKDHLVSEIVQRKQCIYCGTDLADREWRSEFARDLHYKSIVCDCGKDVRIQVEFHGSGHDSWDGTNSWKQHFKKGKTQGKLKNIESKIQNIEAKK